jgi:hypothetical protein
MRYWSWSEIKEKIEDDMDLQEEPDILSEGELMGYVNDAIDVCEQYFIGLGDYFFATTTISVVASTRDYLLPDDIYATKIRKLFNGDREIKPLKDIRYIPQASNGTGDDYSYLIINQPGSKPKIRLFPTPLRDAEFDIYYTRNANRLTEEGGTDQTVDVPEAMLYIMEYVRMCIYKKEKQFQLMMDSKDTLIKLEMNLNNALSQRIDDENNTIEPDSDLYGDMYV